MHGSISQDRMIRLIDSKCFLSVTNWHSRLPTSPHDHLRLCVQLRNRFLINLTTDNVIVNKNGVASKYTLLQGGNLPNSCSTATIAAHKAG